MFEVSSTARVAHVWTSEQPASSGRPQPGQEQPEHTATARASSRQQQKRCPRAQARRDQTREIQSASSSARQRDAEDEKRTEEQLERPALAVCCVPGAPARVDGPVCVPPPASLPDRALLPAIAHSQLAMSGEGERTRQSRQEYQPKQPNEPAEPESGELDTHEFVFCLWCWAPLGTCIYIKPQLQRCTDIITHINSFVCFRQRVLTLP